jgi:hypothetical protein
MAPRKGMSADEKKNTMLKLISSSESVFNKDELEKKGDKAGVVQKTVMDAVKELCAERLVETDKIGAGVFFWSFPSKNVSTLKADQASSAAQADKDEALADELEAKLSVLHQKKAKGGMSEEEKEMKMVRIEEGKKRRLSLEKQIADKANFDPEILGALEKKVKIAKDAADRWTDAIFSIKSYLVKKHGLENAKVDAMLGIKDSFDYVA